MNAAYLSRNPVIASASAALILPEAKLNALRMTQRVNYRDVIYNLLASGTYLPEIASYLAMTNLLR